jgi:beta-phosphoglucomutase-like phosphatase (HAD superfamily)
VRGGEGRGVETADLVAVKAEQLRTICLISGIVALLAGLKSKMRLRMASSSREMGRMVLRNLGSFIKARKVLSSEEARFQGLRPQVRLTKITPRLQMSLGAEA